MGDIGDFYKDVRKAGQEKRAANRQNSANLLTERGIVFDSKNVGAHLIVTHNGQTADFWPGTGKFIIRGGKKGFGVFRLIKEMENA